MAHAKLHDEGLAPWAQWRHRTAKSANVGSDDWHEVLAGKKKVNNKPSWPNTGRYINVECLPLGSNPRNPFSGCPVQSVAADLECSDLFEAFVLRQADTTANLICHLPKLQRSERKTRKWLWVKTQIVPRVNIPIPIKIGFKKGGATIGVDPRPNQLARRKSRPVDKLDSGRASWFGRTNQKCKPRRSQLAVVSTDLPHVRHGRNFICLAYGHGSRNRNDYSRLSMVGDHSWPQGKDSVFWPWHIWLYLCRVAENLQLCPAVERFASPLDPLGQSCRRHGRSPLDNSANEVAVANADLDANGIHIATSVRNTSNMSLDSLCGCGWQELLQA